MIIISLIDKENSLKHKLIKSKKLIKVNLGKSNQIEVLEFQFWRKELTNIINSKRCYNHLIQIKIISV